MNAEWRKLEQEIDAGLRSLGSRLDAPPLRPAVLEQIRAAVRAEASGRVQLRRRVRYESAWSAMAVAACIALVLAWPWASVPQPSEPDLAVSGTLSDWLGAADESGEQITMLLEGEWSADGGREWERGRDTLDEALESLEDSLSTMESVFGA